MPRGPTQPSPGALLSRAVRRELAGRTLGSSVDRAAELGEASWVPGASRREFLTSAAAAGSLLLACGDDEGVGGGAAGAGEGGAGGAGGAGCAEDPFAGGERIGELPFIDDGDTELGVPLKAGWDGRLYTDLSTLSADSLITPNDQFYIRTRYPDLLDPRAPWRIRVSGLVERPRELTLAELKPLVSARGVHLMECSGNGRGGSFGLLSAARWAGAPVLDLLASLAPNRSATRVLISGFDGHSLPSENGHSKPGASWIFTFEQLADAFLATEMNEVALPPDHGAPVRLLVPGWYGCTCIKWVDEIVLVDDSEPATAHMKEFASRTQQVGVPELAAMYAPATIDQAAMPVRVESWSTPSGPLLRVVGILWGGSALTNALSIRFGDGPWAAVQVCPAMTTNATWTLWSYAWRPTRRGTFEIRMRVDDPTIVTRRLDEDYYLRTISVVDV